ncbi:MAG TPA: TfuA domain-containing protein, partial [Polyangiaceae bacterium]|nr:TfuA domain-containing protein [Polyangiaceae bacterium]
MDGYFACVAAPWHKEILYAMSQGCAVFGAASMGALRAAELAPFGMVGVGEIFRAFVTGDLMDDDEVALVHAPQEDGYRALSEPMANIRATIARAFLEGVIRESLADDLLLVAKGLLYTQRSYDRVLSKLEELR